jgi:hypothetical protein
MAIVRLLWGWGGGGEGGGVASFAPSFLVGKELLNIHVLLQSLLDIASTATEKWFQS